MNNFNLIGYRCADELFPMIMNLPNRDYLLHWMKGIARTMKWLNETAYQVDGHMRLVGE